MGSGDLKKVMGALLQTKSKRIVTGTVRTGRRTDIMTVGKQGRYLKYRAPKTGEVNDIALLPTIKAAIMHSKRGKIEVKKRDYREKVRRRKISTLICLVLDASSSMVIDAKMKSIKDALEELMLDAYQKRDRISLVSCFGRQAEVVLPFTSSIEKGKQYIEKLAFGGTTPLAAGIRQGLENLRAKLRIEKDTNPLLIVVTDGSANTPIVPGQDIETEILDTCMSIERYHIPTLIIDVSREEARLAKRMAEVAGGVYFHLEHSETAVESVVKIEDVIDFDKVMEFVSIGLVDPNFKGAVFQSYKKPVVRSALEFIDALSLEFRAIDCASGCDPGDPESFCYECRLRYLEAEEPPDFKTVLRTFPIVQLDKDHTTKEMMGEIYIRFLSTTSNLSEVNRGILFIENIDQLDKDISEILARTLRDRTFTLEKDGRSMTFPCKFSVIGTLSKKGVAVNPLLEKQITLFVSDDDVEGDLEYKTKYIQYKKDYDADPANFQTRVDRGRREWIMNYLRARKIMLAITLPEALEKALDRFSTEISVDECFPPKLKGLAKVMAAKNLKTEVSDADAAEAIEIMRRQERLMPVGEVDIPPVLRPFVGVAEAVAEAEVLKDKLLLLLVSMEEIGGALIRGFSPDAVRSALRYLQEMEFTIRTVEGCRYSCDPERPEEFCSECRIKYERNEMNVVEEKLPVVFLPQGVDVDALKGSVFVSYVVRPNLLMRAHRGIMFVENIDELEHDVETALASALATGINSVERDGTVVKQPCRILLVATIGDAGAELHPLISGRLSVLLEATPEDRTLIRLRALEYLEEFGTQPDMFSSGIMASKESSRTNVLTGQKLMSEIQILDTQLDLIARMCAEFDVEGNSNEFRIESVAKSLTALRGDRRVDDDDIVNAAQMVIPLSASSKGEKREELAESIRQMVLQYA